MQTFVINGATCFPLEPTDGKAYIGYPHAKEEIQALVDPVEHHDLRFSAEKTFDLQGS